MMELEGFFFDNLTIAKRMWDEGFSEKFLKSCGSLPVDTEEYYEVSWEGLGSVFEDVRCYYNAEDEVETAVCFDPLFDEFFRLCVKYEMVKGISSEANPMRRAGQIAVHESFGFMDYSCDWWLYDECHGRPRLVILMSCEFCGHYLLPGALADARNEVKLQIARFTEKLGELGKEPNVIPAFPERKEAA